MASFPIMSSAVADCIVSDPFRTSDVTVVFVVRRFAKCLAPAFIETIHGDRDASAANRTGTTKSSVYQTLLEVHT